jgi:hypothetical protein
MKEEKFHFEERLKKSEWMVADCPLKVGQELVQKYHYAKGGSNTRVFMHGLYKIGSDICMGVAWWIPPTKSAALATYPRNWQGVLSLSRLAIDPSVPKNACSFLMARSIRMIPKDRWPCLVTYADDWRGHDGTIYKAYGWQYAGKTNPEATYTKDGVLRARKAGQKTNTHSEMIASGCKFEGRFSKHKYVIIRESKAMEEEFTY